MKKILSTLLLTLLIIPFGNVKSDEVLQIYENNIYAQNHNTYANVYWATNKEANCNVVYGESSDLINTYGEGNKMSEFGNLIQTPDSGNDGRYHYTKEINISNDRYYKILCVDNEGITKESTIYSMLSDLTITNIKTPNGIKLNEDSLVKVSIKNNGGVDAVDYDLRTNHLGANFVSAQNNVPHTLTPGESFDYLIYLKYTNPGTYVIKSEIDSDDAIDELDENNNVFEKTIIVGEPDLTIQSVSFSPHIPYLGERFSGQIKINIKNIGNNSVSSGARSTDDLLRVTAVLSNNWTLLNKPSPDYKYIGDIAPNEIEEVVFNVNNLKIDSGSLELRVWVDSNGIIGNNYYDLVNDNWNIDESNEDNNTWLNVYQLVPENPTCSETDGGKNYYKKGKCNGVASWGKSIPASNISDSCNSSKQLTELWCGSDGYIYQESYICPNGCHDGACIRIAEKPKSNNSTPSRTAKRLKGRLLLGVQQGGAIWFVDDINYQRHQVNWDNALPLFQKFALGITDEDLLKIPVTLESIRFELDTDGDGYSDRTELENGYSPYVAGSYKGKFTADKNFANRLKGKFLLQVNQGGAIWYVDQNGIRHNVRWDNLRPLFEALALGINNTDLGQIESGD